MSILQIVKARLDQKESPTNDEMMQLVAALREYYNTGHAVMNTTEDSALEVAVLCTFYLKQATQTRPHLMFMMDDLMREGSIMSKTIIGYLIHRELLKY